MEVLEQETDSLSSLEERIVKAVHLVSRLRQERDAALKDASEAKSESGRLSQELDSLRAERKQVRSRIEKLLAQIDQLSTG